MIKQLKFKYLTYFILAVIISFPIFGHLETLPIRMFDESRQAVNAFEMYQNGNYIVTHFAGQPDMWNTKPPLLIWFQVLFIKMLRVSELPIRLPSAISAFFVCVFLIWFSVRYIKDFWFGFIACIVLTSSVGYVHVHAIRTGDYDSLLTLFTTLYPLLFLVYLETGKVKYLYFSFIAITLSVLTKGVAGILFIPVLPLLALYQKKFIKIVSSRHLYFGLGIFVLFIGGYYFLRELKNPGYLEAVWNNELGGRYAQTIEQHKEGFWFYFRKLVDHHFVYWYILVPCGIVVGFFHRNSIIRKVVLYSSALALFYFLVVSISQTKLEWYIVPLYPYLAIIVAAFLHLIFRFIYDSPVFKNLLSVNVLPYIFLFAVSIVPVSQSIGRTNVPKEFSWDVDFYRISYFLRDALRGKVDLDGYTLIHEGYNAHNYFYVEVLKDKGMDIAIIGSGQNLQPNQKVIAFQDHIKDFIIQNYDVDTIKQDHNVVFYQIKSSIKND